MKQGRIVESQGVCYYKDDKLHRDDDLPAVEEANGTKRWYQNGKKHRIAGPAIIFDNIVELYYINNKELTKEQHANHPEVKKYKLQQILNRMV